MYTYIHIYIYAYIYIYIYKNYICRYTYICMHVYIYIHIYICVSGISWKSWSSGCEARLRHAVSPPPFQAQTRHHNPQNPIPNSHSYTPGVAGWRVVARDDYTPKPKPLPSPSLETRNSKPKHEYRSPKSETRNHNPEPHRYTPGVTGWRAVVREQRRKRALLSRVVVRFKPSLLTPQF